MSQIKFKKLANGTINISGLTEGDIRLWSWAIDEGSFAAGDKGGELSRALLRLSRAMRVLLNFKHVEIIGGTSDATVLYDEDENLR